MPFGSTNRGGIDTQSFRLRLFNRPKFRVAIGVEISRRQYLYALLLWQCPLRGERPGLWDEARSEPDTRVGRQ